ncbi:hypothetical protein CEXT_795051 [Caerostris extrusa]|uniref:Uncharacterized protein n=1 Tax=Caerostris extrusa TaxID=172846 RepID=A0AAV4TUT1_CAEEX|nr:hypothetical protein CEXT_795051 [Caerostris extrusa]
MFGIKKEDEDVPIKYMNVARVSTANANRQSQLINYRQRENESLSTSAFTSESEVQFTDLEVFSELQVQFTDETIYRDACLNKDMPEILDLLTTGFDVNFFSTMVKMPCIL